MQILVTFYRPLGGKSAINDLYYKIDNGGKNHRSEHIFQRRIQRAAEYSSSGPGVFQHTRLQRLQSPEAQSQRITGL